MAVRPRAPRRRPALERACRPVFEQLETRRLLTTLYSNEIFEFQDGEGQRVRIQINAQPNPAPAGQTGITLAQSSVTAEFIGSNVNELNQIGLNDLPGRIISSPFPGRSGTDVLGGIAGGKGVQIIGQTPINDGINGFSIAAPSGDNNLKALAANAIGFTFGFNITTKTIDVTIPPPAGSQPGAPSTTGTLDVPVVQLVSIDPTTGAGTVVFSLEDQLPNTPDAAGSLDVNGDPVNISNVTSIEAADFGPDGNLYFVAQNDTAAAGGGGGEDTATSTPRLFRVNTTTGVVTAIQGTFGVGTTDGPEGVTVNTMTFRNDGSLVGYGTVTRDGETTNTFFGIPTNNTNSTGFGRGFFLDGDSLSLSALEAVPGDVNLYGISGNNIVRISPAGGVVLLGSAGDPNDQDPNDPGSNIQGIAWNPVLTDPFQGTLGALIGTDTTTDTLVFVDRRNRFPKSDLYKAYVADSVMSTQTGLTSITIATLPAGDATDTTTERTLQPFEGSAGTFRVIGGQSGMLSIVDAPEGSGAALIGARTRDINPDVATEDRIPIMSAPVNQTFGVFPQTSGSISPGFETAAGENLGRFFLGGTITGNVTIGASLDTFYGGWIITGASGGYQERFDGTTPSFGNFSSVGDVRNIISPSSIGTSESSVRDTPVYLSGFSLDIGGKLGEVRTLQSFLSGGSAVNNGVGLDDSSLQQEIEYKPDSRFKETPQNLFAAGQLSNGESYYNDSRESAQGLSTVHSSVAGAPDVIQVTGDLGGTFVADTIDYYSVALLAGQRVTAQLNSATPRLHLAVYDSDGRLIASDTNRAAGGQGSPFQFVSDRPGRYYFAVSGPGDANSNDEVDQGETAVIYEQRGYSLVLGGVGDIAWGSVHATQNIMNTGVNSGFSIPSGDLGSFVADGDLLSDDDFVIPNEVPGTDYFVQGNMRSMEGANIGAAVRGEKNRNLGFWPIVNGSMGLVRSTAGVVVFNDYVNPNFYTLSPVGGDIQVIDAATAFYANLQTNHAIGTISATDIMHPDVTRAMKWQVNSDNTDFDGRIDLIDTVNFGDAGAGGPQIETGPGGDVGVIRATGDVYRDPFFGTGVSDGTTFDVGEVATLTDDSGAVVQLNPGVATPNPAFNPADPLSVEPQFLNGPQLSNVLTYGIRGSGGSVILSVDASDSLTITSSSTQAGARVGLGVVTVNGTGAANIANPNAGAEPPVTVDENGVPINLAVTVTGSAPVDIFDLHGGNFNTITNNTGGDIVNMTASSIGSIFSDGPIGLSRSSTGAIIRPKTIVSDVFPFDEQRTAIQVAGDVVAIRSNRGIGNLIVDGDIGIVAPNVDNTDSASEFEGINRPVFAGGDIINANIGEGIKSHGSGANAEAGLFAGDRIVSVTNQGQGSDVRGTIAASGGIDNITLTNGALINARVMVVSDLGNTAETSSEVTVLDTADTLNTPVYEIGNVVTTGTGGIIGTIITAADVGNVRAGGFGIINSTIQPVGGSNSVGSIRADGYGIRFLRSTGGANVGEIIATGNGTNLPSSSFTPSVRGSETGQEFDPNTGLSYISGAIDLNAKLTTSRLIPVIDGQTNSGVIEDIFARGGRDLGTIKGFQIRSSSPLNPSTLNFANAIDTIQTASVINILNVTTGRLKKFLPATDVFMTNVTVSGKIDKIKINGNFAANSFINAIGPNASIKEITIAGNLDGGISSTGSVGKVKVGGNVTGIFNINSQGSGTGLKELTLGGSLTQGSLQIQGNVDKITAAGSLGAVGDTLTISGNLKELNVGSKNTLGAAMNLNLNVAGDLGKANIFGASNGLITVGKQIKTFNVTGDAATGPNAITGAINAGTKIGKMKVTNRSIGANITATQDIDSITITNGNLAGGTTILSVARGIKTVKVTGGFIAGSIIAATKLGTITSAGSLGDGLTPMSISGFSLGTLSVGGSVLNGVSVSIATSLGTLKVGGNVDAGASIVAGSIGKKQIAGLVLGTVSP